MLHVNAWKSKTSPSPFLKMSFVKPSTSLLIEESPCQAFSWRLWKNESSVFQKCAGLLRGSAP